MSYVLPPHIRCCRADGWFIFLDARANRYSRLPAASIEAFELALRSAGRGRSLPLDAVCQAGLLSWVPSDAARIVLTTTVPVGRSAIETDVAARAKVADLLLVLIVMVRAWLQPGRVLDLIRQHDAVPREGVRSGEETGMIVREANAFAASRRLLPFRPNCLRDSLALRAFLACRGIASALVVGVRGAPFRAHCWVQVGDVALNETVDGAGMFTPIGVA